MISDRPSGRQEVLPALRPGAILVALALTLMLGGSPLRSFAQSSDDPPPVTADRLEPSDPLPGAGTPLAVPPPPPREPLHPLALLTAAILMIGAAFAGVRLTLRAWREDQRQRRRGHRHRHHTR